MNKLYKNNETEITKKTYEQFFKNILRLGIFEIEITKMLLTCILVKKNYLKASPTFRSSKDFKRLYQNQNSYNFFVIVEHVAIHYDS